MKNKRIFLIVLCISIMCAAVWVLREKTPRNGDRAEDSPLFSQETDTPSTRSPSKLESQKARYDDNPAGKTRDRMPPNQSDKNIIETHGRTGVFQDRGDQDESNWNDDTETGSMDSDDDDYLAEDRRILEIKARVTEAVLNDYDRFSKEEIEYIGDRYEEGIRKIDTPDGRNILTDIYLEYPGSNRGGCAAMNLAVFYYNDNQPEQAMGLVDGLIESETGSVYYNGVQVLPAALFLKGKLQGPLDARETFNRLLEEFPEAIDSNRDDYATLIEEFLQEQE